MQKDKHLARLRLADLILDTKIYNGHATTTDALYAGLPLVTICGKHFASRVSTSLLNAVGMYECVTMNVDQYYLLIQKFITDNQFYLSVFEKLEKNLPDSNLFATEYFVKDLEFRLKKVVEHHTQGVKQAILLLD